MRALTKSGIIVAGLALLVVLLVAISRQSTSDVSAPSASKSDGAVAADVPQTKPRVEKLRDGANLTATQSDEVLAILTDTQMQSEFAWRELGIAIDELDDERPNLATIRRTLKVEMLSRLRDVLSHEQMVTFRRTSLISEPLSLGNYLPLEIAIP